jgi:hypothetical protein
MCKGKENEDCNSHQGVRDSLKVWQIPELRMMWMPKKYHQTLSIVSPFFM